MERDKNVFTYEQMNVESVNANNSNLWHGLEFDCN